ncbi:MAG: 4-hydroxy-tetrahydrodipicolinate reductase [Clostridiales bacterium]|jgi:4-hydroxy-tetrahydrodipicolinate reductase|nr:4-hydroxy-tetrahydrodipicolinate reductase [Clostridiales bacterium]
MKLIICGYNGRMGRAVAAAAVAAGHTVAAGIDAAEDATAAVPVYAQTAGLPHADAVVDFSRPAALPMLLDYAVHTKTPLVLATTGYSEGDTAAIAAAAKKVPIFFSRNMSVGIALLRALCERAATVLGAGFDVEIIEKHHNQKQDAPSGTALMLAEAVNEGRETPLTAVYGRGGNDCKRKPDELGIHAVRGGNIVGEHDVLFIGAEETVTLSHTANSRSVFALGAVRAAAFIAQKRNGLYDMKDLVK